MRYLPHSAAEIADMLSAEGVGKLEDLFAHIPDACPRKQPLNLPEPPSEWELDRHMDGLSGTTAIQPEYMNFMGAARKPRLHG